MSSDNRVDGGFPRFFSSSAYNICDMCLPQNSVSHCFPLAFCLVVTFLANLLFWYQIFSQSLLLLYRSGVESL